MKIITTLVTSSHSSTLHSFLALTLLALITLTQTSCISAQGNLELVSSTNHNLSLNPEFSTVLYQQKNANTALIILADVEQSALLNGNYTSANILIIDMFLRPKAGSTPITGTATNATFRHLILVGDNLVGLYGGGGFLYPTTKASKDHLSGEIFDASLEIIQNSPGFVDRLKTLKITGKITAQRADVTVKEIAYAINTEVSRRLGQVYFVIPD